MKNYKYIALIIVMLLYSCKNDINQKKNTVIPNQPSVKKHNFSSYNYCSKDMLFDDGVYGNMMLQITPNNNFLKCTSVNDTQFVFSCGRGKKEVTLLKMDCNNLNILSFDGLSLPKLEYDDDDIMILHLKAGSDSWSNYFINFSENIVFSEQALYIDEANRRYIYLDNHDYKNGNVFFVVHDIMSNTRDTIKSNYYKYRKDGYPPLHISNISMKYDTIFYSISLKNNLIKDTIIKKSRNKNG